MRLLKLRILRIVPVKTKLLINCLPLVEKHQLYIADALQLVTAKYVSVEILYTGDRGLARVAELEGLKSVSPLTVFPLAGLGLRVGSLASPTPHGPQSSPTPLGSHLCSATTAPLTAVRITRGLYPLILSPPKLKYLLFSCRTVATSHTVFDSSPNTITSCIYSYLQLGQPS